MVSLKWCITQKNGIELIEPNQNMSASYEAMARESIIIIDNVKQSKIWTATTTYYIFYYSLYALMMRIGIKCEIHSCSLEFMRQCLEEFYSPLDIKRIESAFSARIDLQYYANRAVDASIIEENKKYCTGFYLKTKDAIVKINENQVKNIRKKISEGDLL